MSKGRGRSFVLTLALLTVLALVGCGSSKPKVSAGQVMQNALAAQAIVTSNHVEITDNASAQGTWNGSALNVSMDGSANGDIDWTNKKMESHVGMNIEYNTVSLQISADVYAVDNYTYTQVFALGMADNWTKSALPFDVWFTQENAQLISSILQSTQAGYLPDEKVGGINCHVMQLTPDITAIQSAIQQMLSQQSSNQSELPSLADLISNLSFKVWVARDTSFITKTEIALSAHVTPEALGKTANGDALDITLSITMQATDFNKPVSIELPAEAQNAQEGGFKLPLNMFGF